MKKETPFCLSVNTQNNIFLLNCSLAFCYHMSYYNNQTCICGKTKNHSEEVVLTTIQSLKNAFCQSVSAPLTRQAAAGTLGHKELALQLASACSSPPGGRGGSDRGIHSTGHRGWWNQTWQASCFALGGATRQPNTSATTWGGSVPLRQRELRSTMKWVKYRRSSITYGGETLV